MNIFQIDTLITSAPAEIQIALGTIFAVAAVSLFCLGVENGTYPAVRTWLSQCIQSVRHIRQYRTGKHSYPGVSAA